MKIFTLLALWGTFIASFAAESKGPDPFADELFSPEAVLAWQQEIGLADEQREQIIDLLHDAQKRSPRLENEKSEVARELLEMVKAEKPEVTAILRKLDELEKKEGELRRLHVGLLVRIKNILTARQQKELKVLRDRGPVQFPPRSIQEKLEKVEKEVQEWVGAGRDPASIAEMMQDFSGLIGDGKLREADALLERALKKLSEKEEK